MAEVARADPAGAGVASAAQGVDQDICEVERLLALSQRPVIAHRLAVFLSELQQGKATSQEIPCAFVGSLQTVGGTLFKLHGSHDSVVNLVTGRTSSDSLQTTQFLGPSCSPMEGIPLPRPALPGIVPLMGGVDRMVPGFLPPTMDERQFSGASDHSDSGTFQQMSGLPERSGLPSPLGPQLWPLAFTPGNPSILPAQPFQQLTTCSWEQNDTIVKVYVPLRGIQTDMLRPVFTANSAEVRVINLQGKNYIFTLAPTFYPIAEAGCTAAASKTRKNIIITLQKLHTFLPEHRQWRGLYGERAAMTGLGPL